MIRALIIVLMLVSCAINSPSPYGNRLNSVALAYNRVIAIDSVKKLVTLYPPAGTTIDLKQFSTDEFGELLVSLLRTEGYAIIENSPAIDAPTRPSISLNYIIDQVPSMALYRATLFVNGQPLSRVYSTDTGVLEPAGSWVRRE